MKCTLPLVLLAATSTSASVIAPGFFPERSINFTTSSWGAGPTPTPFPPATNRMTCSGGLDTPCQGLCTCSGGSVNCHADPTSRCAQMCTC
ncbi:hypothetical protein F4819DRAFT_458180 [Hypoxylon fuscum]|nr:hypothetical protein F4819DRAFT_458180 [Hypoxylon fuscum]